jgi:integrase
MSKRRGFGEGSVYQEGPQRWVAFLSAGFETAPDGTRRRVRKKFVGKTKQEVVNKLMDARRALQLGVVVARASETLEEWLTAWLSTKAGHLRPRTYGDYARLIYAYLIPSLGRLRLTALRPLAVEQALARIALGGKVRTAQHCHGILRAALNDALRQGLVVRNVAALVRSPKAPASVALERRKYLDAEQARRLLAALELADDPLEFCIAAMLFLGLRIGEALALTWKDLDFERRTLTVRRTLQRTGGEFTIKDGKLRNTGTQLIVQAPKTERSVRTLALPEPLLQAALRQKARQEAMRRLADDGWVETGFITTTAKGTPLEYGRVNKRLADLCAKLGLPRVSPHSLRHSCATLMIAAGCSLAQVQQVLGHSQVHLTANLYAHLLTEATRAPLERIAEMVSPGAPRQLGTQMAPKRQVN